MRFAFCPSCSRWRAVVGFPTGGRSYRTRRHGSCGIVTLPDNVELRVQ